MNKLIALIVLSWKLPRLAWRILAAIHNHQSIALIETPFIGCDRRPFTSTAVKINNKVMFRFGYWLNVLDGNLSLVGPKPITPQRAKRLSQAAKRRFTVKPGLIAPFSVKKMAGIAHDSEAIISSEFARSASVMRRAQIGLVFLLLKLIGKDESELSEHATFNLFGVDIDNITMQQVMSSISHSLKHNTRKKMAFVNADCANQYYKNKQYKNTLQNFDYVYADGIGIKIAAHMQHERIVENVNGTDMFPLLCKQLQASGHSVYFLGAEPQVINTLVEKTRHTYPSLNIAGHCDGYTHNQSPKTLINKINKSGADIVLVGMGAPRQEQWIEQYFDSLNSSIAIGVGGLFDFYSGNIQRAPTWMRELSLEWVWRLLMQPMAKGKRYLIGNPLFLYRSFIAAHKNSRTFVTKAQGLQQR